MKEWMESKREGGEEEYLMTRRCGIVVGGDGHNNNNKCPCVVVMGELEKMGGSSL